ncbi:Importin subunit beta-1 [Linum perenne]
MKIRQASFECLVSISSMYYEKLAPYIQDLFNITSKEVKEDDESMALQHALPALVSILFETILKQEKDQDEGAWNIAMAGGTCLYLVEHTVGDEVVPLVMPFIEQNITKPDWREREAITYAFGSILEGPSIEKLTPLVNVALNFMMIALTKDPNNHVKDTIGWTLGRIFEFLHGSTTNSTIITQENCQ